MYAVRSLLACTLLLIITCRAGRDFVFDEEITVQEIVRSYTQEDHSTKLLQRSKKRGHATNCDPKGSRIDITWTPEIIIIGQDVTLYINATTATSFSVGTFTIDIFMGNSTKGEPMLELSDATTCSEIQKYVTFLTCPIKKKTHVFLASTQPTNTLPIGVYSARVRITNELKETLVCIESTVTIKAPDN